MWGGPQSAVGEGAKGWEIPGVAEILFQAFLPGVSPPPLHPRQLPPPKSGITPLSSPSHQSSSLTSLQNPFNLIFLKVPCGGLGDYTPKGRASGLPLST